MVPGYGNSGPLHWQSLWEAQHPAYQRVEQDDWEQPHVQAWVDRLNAAIQQAPQSVVLVAHSLGCMTVVRWAQQYTGNVVGALLVAPVDLDEPTNIPLPVRQGGFTPIPLDPLPFPAIVVASTSDPYAHISRAQGFAKAWGASFVDVGDCGHLNADAGFGPWAAGEQLLADLIPRA